jgi:hypothetical protein
MDPLLYSAQQWALRRTLCSEARRALSSLYRPTTSQRLGPHNTNRIGRRHKGYIAPEGGQAHPLDGFYAGTQSGLPTRQELTS